MGSFGADSSCFLETKTLLLIAKSKPHGTAKSAVTSESNSATRHHEAAAGRRRYASSALIPFFPDRKMRIPHYSHDKVAPGIPSEIRNHPSCTEMTRPQRPCPRSSQLLSSLPSSPGPSPRVLVGRWVMMRGIARPVAKIQGIRREGGIPGLAEGERVEGVTGMRRGLPLPRRIV